MVRTLAGGLLFVAFCLTGCGGGNSAKVVGKITCGGKPVKGNVLFSPFGEGADNTGPAVNAELKEDGGYEVQLKTIGKHRIVVSPSDIVYPAKPGKEYPCDLKPIEKELKAGDNQIDIPLSHRP